MVAETTGESFPKAKETSKRQTNSSIHMHPVYSQQVITCILRTGMTEIDELNDNHDDIENEPSTITLSMSSPGCCPYFV